MKFFKDVEKTLNDLKSRSQGNNNNNIYVPFKYLNRNPIVGQIMIPLTDNGEESDVYVIKKIHKFGKNIIPSNQYNDEILKEISGLSEFLKQLRNIDIDFRVKYRKVDSLSIGLFNPKQKSPVFILNIQGITMITNFLEKIIDLYNQHDDDIFKCILELKRGQGTDVIVSVKKVLKQPSTELLKSLLPDEHEKYRKLLYHKLYDDFRMDGNKIKSVVMKWKSEIDKLLPKNNVFKNEFTGGVQEENNLEEEPDWFKFEEEENLGETLSENLVEKDFENEFLNDDDNTNDLFEGIDLNDENTPDFLKE